MLAKLLSIRKKIAVTLVTAVLMTFFGYVGYIDLFYDGASVAEDSVAKQIIELENSEPKAMQLPKTSKSSKYFGLKRAEIALIEHRKGVSESPSGCNCGPEVDKYTEGYHSQWCAMFASWVAKEAGSPFANDKNDSWKIISSRDLAMNLSKHGTWYSREEVIEKNIRPRIGDFVVFWRGNFEDDLGHVDVVVDLGDKPGVAGMVGGNLGSGYVGYRKFSYLQNYGFFGFGRPEKD